MISETNRKESVIVNVQHDDNGTKQNQIEVVDGDQ